MVEEPFPSSYRRCCQADPEWKPPERLPQAGDCFAVPSVEFITVFDL